MAATFQFSGAVRFVLFNEEDCEPHLILVDDEQEYASTVKYLNDEGVSYSVREIEPKTVEQLRYLIATRND